MKDMTYRIKIGSCQGSHLRHIHTQATYHHHGCKIHTNTPRSCAVHLTIEKPHLRTGSPPAWTPLPVASPLPLSHLLAYPEQLKYYYEKMLSYLLLSLSCVVLPIL